MVAVNWSWWHCAVVPLRLGAAGAQHFSGVGVRGGCQAAIPPLMSCSVPHGPNTSFPSNTSVPPSCSEIFLHYWRTTYESCCGLHTPCNPDVVLSAQRGFKPSQSGLDEKGQLHRQLTLSCWCRIICSRGCTIKITSVKYHFGSDVIVADILCKPDLSALCEDLSLPLTQIFKDIKMPKPHSL